MSRKSKELNLQAYDISMGIFDFKVRVIIGEYQNALKYIAWMQKIDDPDSIRADFIVGKEPHGETFRGNDWIPVIWLPVYPTTPKQISTLSHESVHAMVAVYRWLNMPINYDTEEMLCHGMAHIVRETLTAFKPK